MLSVFRYHNFYKISEDPRRTVLSIFDMLIDHNVALFIVDQEHAFMLTQTSNRYTVN